MRCIVFTFIFMHIYVHICLYIFINIYIKYGERETKRERIFRTSSILHLFSVNSDSSHFFLTDLLEDFENDVSLLLENF